MQHGLSTGEDGRENRNLIIKLIVYPVKDIEKARAFYGKFLDVEPYVEGSYYVGYRVGDQEVGLDPNSKVGPIAYTDVKDIKSSLLAMIEVGAEVVQDVHRSSVKPTTQL